MKRRSLLTGAVTCALAIGCFRPSQFDRLLADQKWTDAAALFAGDSALINNEDELYRAGLLFSTPGRSTYDLPHARELLAAFLSRFPASSHADDARAKLALIDDVTHGREALAARERELEGRIAALVAETHSLSARLDSAVAARDSLRTSITRLENDRRDRDEQIRALRLELQRLKEIDLKPRPPIKP